MSSSAYLDTSAVLRAELEAGFSADVVARVGAAEVLITSRLALVESARAFHRLRALATIDETRLADAERSVERLWARCEIWEVDRDVCQLAGAVAPRSGLRTLDAIHLATFLLARRRIEGLLLVSTDERLLRAAESV